jgi:hypothetical protein
MRTVKKEMSHEEYAHICDGIDSHIPWGLVSRDYNNRLLVGIFRFWDESYIPEKLKPFMIKPPNHDELVSKLDGFLNI